ncbi:ATP-binding cassette domain-containing protein, partial [Campylobacter fetus subsp. venerealis]
AVIDEIAAYEAETAAQLPGPGGQAARLSGPATLWLSGCVTPAGRLLPDIRIAEGERVALVGPSGAGKTSALRLMAGLDVPDRGRVLLAGQVLR